MTAESLPPETTVRPSDPSATALTAPVCPVNGSPIRSPDAGSQMMTVPSDPAAATRSDTRPGSKTRDQVPRVPPPTFDLNGLTDQVIRAIDRRIIAQRERLGRP